MTWLPAGTVGTSRNDPRALREEEEEEEEEIDQEKLEALSPAQIELRLKNSLVARARQVSEVKRGELNIHYPTQKDDDIFDAVNKLKPKAFDEIPRAMAIVYLLRVFLPEMFGKPNKNYGTFTKWVTNHYNLLRRIYNLDPNFQTSVQEIQFPSETVEKIRRFQNPLFPFPMDEALDEATCIERIFKIDSFKYVGLLDFLHWADPIIKKRKTPGN